MHQPIPSPRDRPIAHDTPLPRTVAANCCLPHLRFDHRPAWHQAETHAVAGYCEAHAGEHHATTVSAGDALSIDASHPQHAGHLDEAVAARRLATASGGLGSSAGYLFRTLDSLRANDIRDAELERLAAWVETFHADDRLLAAA